METVSAAQDDSSGANPSSVKSDDSSPRHEGGRGSPPPHCAICLGTCRNKSFTDSCLHQFCFKCLLTWSKVKAECPLCKQNFKSIIHNVRSNHQYDEYTVEQRVEEATHSIDIDSLTNATRRFRYRTTLTLPRRETLAIQQLLLHYPLFPPRAPPTRRRRRDPAAFRRSVYVYNLWARPLPDFTGRFRDCTPEFYRYNESQMHRLLPWINRELQYLLNENAGHIAYVMTRIQELLPQYHINSPEFREAMHRYFGDRTEHFLYELFCFASTPYDLNGYDRNIQYTTDSRVSTMVNEVISSSESEASVDSDIVMVSHSEPAEPPPGPSRVPPPVYPHHYPPAPPAADNVIPIETISQSDSDDDSSEVMVVGYIKPPQDRTPEVVDLLGSDSDVIVQDGAQDAAEPEPQPAAPLVKLSLKRQRRASDSSGDLWTVLPRRRRAHSATTSDTSRDTPPPQHRAPASSASSFAVSTSTTSSSSSDSDGSFGSSSPTSSSSSGRRRRLTRKKAKRKSRRSKPVERSRKRARRGESPRRRERRSPSRTESRDRRCKRKSHAGKGVKSSKRPAPADAPTADRTPPLSEVPRPPCASSTSALSPEPTRTPPLAEPAGTPPLPEDRAGPSDRSQYKSGRSRYRCRASQERRRLKSVVNVMYKNSGDSNSGCSSLGVNGNPSSEYSAKESMVDETIRKRAKTSTISTTSISPVIASRVSDGDTDSEDNLPLNLSVQKTFHSL